MSTIHIVIGTKAQLVKMSPIIRICGERGLPLRLINAGQHAGSVLPLLEHLGLPSPDVTLHQGAENISTVSEGLRWLGRLSWDIAAHPAKIRDHVFGGHSGICLVHGDTATTWVSLLMAKRAGIPVAHVEAGLRSFKALDPFPEELIRIATMRFADLLFAPSTTARDNLLRMGYGAKAVFIEGNTVEDAVAHALEQEAEPPPPAAGGDHALVSIHRFETVRSRQRMHEVVDLVDRIAATRRVILILHRPTKLALEKTGLMARLQGRDDVLLLPLQPYIPFVRLINGAAFVVTDGGSIQEECAILGKPCLVLRTATEREDGIGGNAVLGSFDDEVIGRFIEAFRAHERPANIRDKTERPSERIVDEIVAWLARHQR